MHPELQTLDTETAQALTGLDAAQTQATPLDHPEKWSIQQVVEHLLLTYRSTIPLIQARLDKRSPTRAQPTLAQRFTQWMILDLGRFPYGRPSPEAVYPSLPATLQSGEELSQRVQAELTRLDVIAAEAEQVLGRRRSVSHLILGPLSIAQWRRFHLVHAQHHLKQIKSIRTQHSL